jgi:hypothetical protein
MAPRLLLALLAVAIGVAPIGAIITTVQQINLTVSPSKTRSASIDHVAGPYFFGGLK